MNDLKELARELLETTLEAGAKDSISEAMETKVHQVRFSSSQVDAVNSWTERHVALFVAVGKHTMASDVRDLARTKESARSIVALAKSSPPNNAYAGIASGRFKYKRSKLDPKLLRLDDPSKFVHEAISGAESEGANNVGGTLFIRHYRNAIASTGGALGTDETATIELSVRAFSQPEASGHTVSCTPKLSDLNARKTGERAGELSRMAMNAAPGDEGKTDLVMQPLFIGGVMNSTSDMMSAFVVDIGASMFAKKIGKMVASKEVTFLDDPTISSISTRAFDHEGVPTRRNVIIKNGILKTYLHNTSTAKRFKSRTTANAGPLVPTPFSYPGQPVAFHPVVVPGDWSEHEMIEDTKHGLYLNHTWYTRFQNYTTGEFSTIPRDAILKIEDGEIVGAVKNIRVSDNMMNLWKSIDALSRKAQEIYWWDEATPPSALPMARARSMRITRSA